MKIYKIINKLAISLPLFALLSLTSCSGNSNNQDVLYLRVYNAGDYVYLNDPDNGYDEPDLVDQYNEWINQEENKAFYFGENFNKRVEIIYDTYDTNENMYNELLTGKSNYELVCTSDYMIQKLAKRGFIQTINKEKIPNYSKYASKFLTGEDGKLNNVIIDEENPSLGTLDDFCVGYMWGTLGLMFNPEYDGINNRSKEQVIEDFTSPNGWDTLWTHSEYYDNCASIKDSIRDTYALGIAHALVDENGENKFAKLYNEYSGNYNEEYTKKLGDLFNLCDDETIALVQESLIELKDYIYGFEVDTGKTDIVTGRVGINLAWSGDAVYSMDTAEENDVYLYFAIPHYVTNIWFDAFALMNGISEEQENAAYSFLDFISLPEIAAKNMDYVGYTPFIGGQEIFDLVTEWYDPRYDEDGNFDDSAETIEYDLSYFFNQGEDDTNDYIVHVEPEQINRQMRAQYPLESDLPHLAIMKDFGNQNDKITSMWENVKVNPLPVWVSVIVVLGFVGILGFLGSYRIIQKIKVNRRKKLREKNN